MDAVSYKSVFDEFFNSVRGAVSASDGAHKNETLAFGPTIGLQLIRQAENENLVGLKLRPNLRRLREVMLFSKVRANADNALARKVWQGLLNEKTGTLPEEPFQDLELIVSCRLGKLQGCKRSFHSVATDFGICSALNSVDQGSLLKPSAYLADMKKKKNQCISTDGKTGFTRIINEIKCYSDKYVTITACVLLGRAFTTTCGIATVVISSKQLT